MAPNRGDQFQRREAAVGDQHDTAIRQPPLALQDRLTGPVGQGLVPPALRLAPTGGWCEHSQEGQRPAPVCERHLQHHRQRQPAQTAGFDKLAVR